MVSPQEQEPTPVPDEIDSEQQTLDAQQGEENAVQYITVEQARSLMAEQTRAVVSQVAGLQGKIDNGLNAVRRDSQQWIEQNIGPIMQEQKIQAILKDVPEDQQEWTRKLIEQTMPQPVSPMRPSAPTQPTPDNQAALMEAMGIITQMGGNPQDPKINYQAFVSGDNTTFLKSIGDSMRGAQTATSTPPTIPSRPSPETPNPPVDGPPRSGGTLNTADDVMGAYAEGRIEKDDFVKRMALLGQPVQ